MSGIEQMVRSSLRERAGTDVDAAALVAAATRRGRGRTRRRWLVRCLAAVAVVAAAAGTAIAVPPGAFAPYALLPGTRAEVDLPKLPGVPGARMTPQRVGADPTVLHFDAPALTGRSRHHMWSSGAGYEQLEVGLSTGDLAYATIGADMDLMDDVPRQGGPGYVLREPVTDGLWLRVETSGERLAREVADAVDLDQSQRCALPFRVGTLPRDAELVECYVGFDGGLYTQGGLVVRGSDGQRMEIQAQYVRDLPQQKTANHSAGGRPAFLYPGLDEVELLGYPGLHLSVRLGKASGGFEVADADFVLTRVRVAADVEDLDTWPETLLDG